MKGLWSGFCSAFSLYSVLPVPRVDWKKANMRYALCFFPLIGAAIGALQWGWLALAMRLELAAGLFGAVAVLLPILISGGIHMDGWIDTVDAISSRADPEKKRRILKDPHVGAFGVLGCALYLLIQWGLWQQIYLKPELALLVCVGYVLSRCLNAKSIVIFTPAAQSGLVFTFNDSAARKPVIAACVGMILVALLPCVLFVPSIWWQVMGVGCIIYFLLHKRMCMRQFGGNTGDLAGFLLQNIELWCLIVAVAGGIMA